MIYLLVVSLKPRGIYSDFFASLMSFVCAVLLFRSSKNVYCFSLVVLFLEAATLWERLNIYQTLSSEWRQPVQTSPTCSRLVVLTVWEELGTATLSSLWFSSNREWLFQSCWIYLIMCFSPLNDVVLFSYFVVWQIGNRTLFRSGIKLLNFMWCDKFYLWNLCIYLIPGVDKKLTHKYKTSL